MFSKNNNILNTPNMFKVLGGSKDSKDSGTAFDNKTITSKPTEIQNPLGHLKSDVKSANLNPLQGSKTVTTLMKHQDKNNLNLKSLNSETDTPSSSFLHESKSTNTKINILFEETAFGKKPRNVSGTHTDGIIGDKKVNTTCLNGPKMSQANKDNGLKVNRYLNTGKINRKLIHYGNGFNPLLNKGKEGTRSTDNTKLKPEIKPI
jgi:hypothetical protein